MDEQIIVLNETQERGFVNGDICPACKNMNIIYRRWRDDFVCGWCKAVFIIVKGKIRHLGNQLFLE